MTPDRLEAQLRFILELDKLKSVYRRTILLDRSRNENSAEHSWHIALMAALLAEHAGEKVNVLKTMKMLLVHDIVEIDAGDTYCYDASANVDKATREQRAAERTFGLLPEDQRDELAALWEEFEAGTSAEARFAHAMDRLQPLLNNFHTGGESWQKHGVTSAQVSQRAAAIAEASPALGGFAQKLLHDAVERGYLAK
ncbi:MAG TPA: HD domain-containing protein [Tepidisphaeraceae bacterium]|jgi:putative hydrolase of HD superfamily